MIRFRRHNTLWLIALGVLITFALAAAPLAPAVQALLLGLLGLAVVLSLVQISRPQGQGILRRIRRAPARRASPAAREAADRARTLGGYVSPGLALADIGLITVQAGDDGIVMRRTRSISKDDDGARPFIVLNVDTAEAERGALIRFEITDHTGEAQYVHEMRSYLRDGEMNLMADHHLPLAGNDRIHGMGDWDLRVYIDGSLAGVHSFTLAPSMTERRQRLARDRQQRPAPAAVSPQEEIIEEAAQPAQPSLQDLLKTGGRSSGPAEAARRAARPSGSRESE